MPKKMFWFDRCNNCQHSRADHKPVNPHLTGHCGIVYCNCLAFAEGSHMPQNQWAFTAFAVNDVHFAGGQIFDPGHVYLDN